MRKVDPQRTSYNIEIVSAVVCAVTCRLQTPGTLVSRAVSSWKCVANMHMHFTLAARCSEMAHAKPACAPHPSWRVAVRHTTRDYSPKPSYVEVPRPNSSMITSDEAVAVCEGQAV